MALRQRIGLVILMSMSLFTMVLSILKTIGLKNIFDQQTNPNATDVQYNASLQILWSCLEQAFVIIMGCVPPLRGIMRLELTQSISSSLASILRMRKSSKSSLDSHKYGSSSGPYDSLEMRTDRLGRVSRNLGQSVTAVTTSDQGREGSKQDLVRNKGILSTTETSVSYSQSRDNV
jgi:hypothetical protein